MKTQHMLACGLVASFTASCATPIPEIDVANPKSNTLICQTNHPQMGTYCQTPVGQLNAGQFEKKRERVTFITPMAWTLTGPARGVTTGGREKFNVEAKGRTAHSIDCQWSTSGSMRIGGPGGYVRGYCWAPATQQ